MAVLSADSQGSRSKWKDTDGIDLGKHNQMDDHANPKIKNDISTLAKPTRIHYYKSPVIYTLLSGMAGGIAGCAAKTAVAPLDRVKILFQARNPDYIKYSGTVFGVFRAATDIYHDSGLRGLFQGHSATLLRVFPYAAIKYMCYDPLHKWLMPTAEQETPNRRFLAGSLAGILSACVTYPLELIRVRLAFETHHKSDPASLIKTVKRIAEEGRSSPKHSALYAFYRGVWPSIAGVIPYAGMSFLSWGTLKMDVLPKFMSRKTIDEHSILINLAIGGVSGALGQTAAYPIDVVRRRMQVSPLDSTSGRMSFFQVSKYIWRTQGFRGFFVGLSIGYIKVIPLNAVSFATWIFCKDLFGLD